MTATLTPEHLKSLAEGSGIAHDVIVERGYRTCTGYSELKSLGIRVQRDTDTKGLLLPLHTVEGKPGTTYIAREDRSVPLMVYRPDTPEIDENGRPRKYLYPGDQGMRVDCPPRCAPGLADPAIPLWITEGQKKADALATQGACALALLGVWNWRGRNTQGGVTVLPDWQHVALNDREVRVVFDSDILEKEGVQKALTALTCFLQAKGAQVHIAYLPSQDGAKQGVDDFLLTQSLTDLERLLEAPRQSRRKNSQTLKSLKVTKNGDPRPVLFNILEILTHDPRWEGVFGYDEFARTATVRKRPPYLPGDEPWTIRPVVDEDDAETSNWLQAEYDLCAATSLVAEGMQTLAHRNPYHPIREYLAGLVWDNTPRLDTWLITYCQAKDTPYTRAVGPKTLISGIARVEKPGCKADGVAILQGDQGLLKSTAWRVLAGDDWFSDTMPDIDKKDAMEGLQGKWIIELGELAALQRSEREAIKRFVSASADHYRPSYGRRASTFPRHTIFVGSTNKEQIFQDETGNRRFWPIPVQGSCDIEALRRDRDQLWAEAFARYQAGAIWYLTPGEEALAQRKQEECFEVDPWEEVVLAYVEHNDDAKTCGISTHTIMKDAFQWDSPALWTQAHSKRIGAILRRHGWRHQSCRDKEGKVFKGYKRVTDVTDASDNEGGTGYSETLNENNDVTDVTDVTGDNRDIEKQNTTHTQNSLLHSLQPTKENCGYTGYTGHTGCKSSRNGAPTVTPPQPCPGCGKRTTWLIRGTTIACCRCETLVPRHTEKEPHGSP